MPDKPVFRPGIMLENLHQKSPLIHNITNYVTANDCANILLACGASPIMADDPLEAADITGVILTKMDGTAKGGIAVAIQAELGIPVKYIGVGETIDDLQKFDSDEFVNALFYREDKQKEGMENDDFGEI